MRGERREEGGGRGGIAFHSFHGIQILTIGPGTLLCDCVPEF